MNELADYNFTIKYRPGKENIDADYLSRNPMDITEYRKQCSGTVPGLTGLRLPASQVMEELGPGLTAAVSVEMLSLEGNVRAPEIPRAELQRKKKTRVQCWDVNPLWYDGFPQ